MEKLFNSENNKKNDIIKKKIKKKKNKKYDIDEELESSKFRYLNDFIYSNDSKTYIKYFNNKKEDFEIYHKGYLNQIKKWDIKPLDYIINFINKNSKKFNNLIAVDHGCGNGDFGLNSKMKKIFKEIKSYDLLSLKEHIEICDIKNIPLEKESVDLSIFCLSLMGKNYVEFLIESNRILKLNSYLIICEVNSRIKDNNLMIKLLKELGYNLIENKKVNDYFNFFFLQKIKNKSDYLIYKNKNFLHFNGNYKNTSLYELSKNILNPCTYKKR